MTQQQKKKTAIVLAVAAGVVAVLIAGERFLPLPQGAVTLAVGAILILAGLIKKSTALTFSGMLTAGAGAAGLIDAFGGVSFLGTDAVTLLIMCAVLLGAYALTKGRAGFLLPAAGCMAVCVVVSLLPEAFLTRCVAGLSLARPTVVLGVFLLLLGALMSRIRRGGYGGRWR